jgi:hypothetical protein
MLPPITAIKISSNGTITTAGVAAAGSVPATRAIIGGMALTQDGKLYAVWNAA